MPFSTIGRAVPGMGQIVGFEDRSTGRSTFGGKFGARYCNQWGLTFAATRSCSQVTLGRLVTIATKYNINHKITPSTHKLKP